MPYEITLKPAFLAGLVQLGHKDQKKVSQVVKTIGDNPFQPQTTKILNILTRTSTGFELATTALSSL